jgi:hypothetical protein
MKRQLLYFLALGMAGTSFAQQQFENGDFESWEDAGTVVDEPVDWSSIKTSDVPSLNTFAPQVWDQSTDAHSGSYSLYLENKSSFGIVANGIVSNGRIHADTDPENGYVFTDASDAQWNTPFTSKPDSLVGWYKYEPSGGDHGKVDVILHTGSSFDLPGDEGGASDVGRARFDFPNTTLTSWTRFSVPFYYYSSDTPAYILAVITSGDSTQAVNGSKAWVDDLELIYNVSSVEEATADDISVSTMQNALKVWAQNGWSNEVNLELTDLQGRVVDVRTWNASSDLVWNLNEVHGIYLLRFYVDDKVITKKVFVE